jgi:hypothetical protein
MIEIVVADEHVQIYDLWRERGARGLRLCHVDFHCDMRGLLVDRKRGRAFAIAARGALRRAADSGNFLARAVLEGIVTAVRWVHDPFGGRLHDTSSVKYESDWTALPHCLLHRLRGGQEVPVELEELTFDRWETLRPGEHLDIDWDGLAHARYDLRRVRALVDGLLARPFPERPPAVYLARSPGYSRPELELFEEFLARLARKLDARIARLPPYNGPPQMARPAGVLRRLEERLVLGLRRFGIY